MNFLHRSIALAASLLVVSLTAGRPATVAAQAPASAAQPAPADPQSPTYHAEANLVRVDVYPTSGGRPVADLGAPDFVVLEDGVPQKIESFERVTIQPSARTDDGRGAAVTTDTHPSGPEGRSRIFVLFLDTYFTDLAGSRRARASLAAFVDRLVGPDDLIGIMTPDMSASDISLVHRMTSTEEMLSKYWFWGQRDSEAVDPVEEQYLSCYPREAIDRESGRESYPGVADEMIQRRREKRVIDALADLAKHLRRVSDERKAVITLSDGWVLFKPNLEMTERGRFRRPRPGTKPDGRLTADVEADTAVLSQRCEQDRVSLSLVDDRAAYDALIDSANRSNVSFYPVSLDGLRVFDRDLGAATADPLSGERQAIGSAAQNPVGLPPMRLQVGEEVMGKRIDSLQSLAVNTDGLAVTGTNIIDVGLHRIVDDLSSYYLLGYYSTNPTPDGKFRKIEVRVSRPGVDVRARRGYRAPTRQELEHPDTETRHTRTAKTPLDAVLAELKADRPGVPLRVGAAYAPLGAADSGSSRVHVWALAEIDGAVARHGEWIGGGTIELSVTARDGETLGRKTVTLAGGERSASIDLGEVTAASGEAVVHATARAVGGGRQNYAEALHLESLALPGRPLVYRRSPSTAMKFVPTASPEFSRTERLRVELPVAAAPSAPLAALLDREGKLIPIPVTVTSRAGDGVTWLVAELPLAPLAPGTYIVRVTPDGTHPESGVLSGFRVVP